MSVLSGNAFLSDVRTVVIPVWRQEPRPPTNLIDVPRISLPIVIWKSGFYTTFSLAIPPEPPVAISVAAQRRGGGKGVPVRARRQRTLAGEHCCAIHQC